MARDELATLRVKLEAESARLQKGLDEANNRLRNFERKADTWAAKVKRTFSGAFAGLGALAGAGAFVGITRGMVSVAAESEKLSASLATVTGSAASAEQAFDFIRKFATETPFQVNEIADAFIRLSAYGIEPTDNLLRSLGNTASAMNKTLEQAVEALADAATGEFERLKEFGIKASSEGDRVRFTFRGVTTEVGKNADEITRYLQNIGSNEFAGAMERQVDTLGGAFSNLQDATTRLAGAFAEGSGLAGTVKSATQSLTELINKALEFSNGPSLDSLQKRLDAINSGTLRGRSGRAATGNREQAQIDEQLAALPGAEGVRARLTQTELALEQGRQRIEALQAKIDAIPEDSRRSKTGGRGRSAAALTPFARLSEELSAANADLARLTEQRTLLLNELEATELQFAAGGSGSSGKSSKSPKKTEAEKAIEKEEKRLESLAKSLQQPYDKLYENLADLDKLLDRGMISWDEYSRAVFDSLEGVAEKTAPVKDKFDDLKSAVEGWGRSFADTLVEGGRDMGDFADTILKQFARIALAKTFDPIFSIFGSWVSGAAGDIFGGFRAAGGPVNAGTSYIVGERGPELFVPGSSGSIVPNGAMGSNVVVNVINKATGTQAVTREREENGVKMIDVMIEQVRGAIASDIARGSGAVPSALQGVYGLNRVAGAY